MNKKAIITLLVGDKYQKRWHELCSENWMEYSQKNGCDLKIINNLMDVSSRGMDRSPAWQKLLLLDHPEIRQYEQIAYIDSDIFFNPNNSPNIFVGCPVDKVGAVNSFADPSIFENSEALTRMWARIRRHTGNLPTGFYTTSTDIYKQYDESMGDVSYMLNAGVLVASPMHHAEIWRYVYDHYEDKGNPSYFENVPLSYELVKNNLVHWMNPKFNHLWAWSKELHYPFLLDWRNRSFKDKILRRAAEFMGNNYEYRLSIASTTSTLMNCYCLHFAGHADEMRFVDLNAAKEGIIKNIGIR